MENVSETVFAGVTHFPTVTVPEYLLNKSAIVLTYETTTAADSFIRVYIIRTRGLLFYCFHWNMHTSTFRVQHYTFSQYYYVCITTPIPAGDEGFSISELCFWELKLLNELHNNILLYTYYYSYALH